MSARIVLKNIEELLSVKMTDMQICRTEEVTYK